MQPFRWGAKRRKGLAVTVEKIQNTLDKAGVTLQQASLKILAGAVAARLTGFFENEPKPITKC